MTDGRLCLHGDVPDSVASSMGPLHAAVPKQADWGGSEWWVDLLINTVLPDVHGLGKGNLSRVLGYCWGWAQASMSYLKAKHAVWPLQACAEAARGMYTRENVCMCVRVLDWLLCRTPEASEERRGLQVWASTWQAGPPDTTRSSGLVRKRGLKALPGPCFPM